MSRRSGGNTFLSCRDAAKAFSDLSHQAAYNINLALAQLGVIDVVRRNGKCNESKIRVRITGGSDRFAFAGCDGDRSRAWVDG
jgi:hypothetical protein